MSRPHLFAFCVLATAACAGLASSPSVHATDAECKAVFDAMSKLTTTPHHMSMKETAGFHKGTMESEMITTASTQYVKVNGTWHSSPYDSAEQLKDMQQAAARSKQTCKLLRDEAVDGEAATLYSAHDVQDSGSTVDSQIWISKSSGLPIQQTIDINVGGARGKSHTDARIDYANVQEPAGA